MCKLILMAPKSFDRFVLSIDQKEYHRIAEKVQITRDESIIMVADNRKLYNKAKQYGKEIGIN